MGALSLGHMDLVYMTAIMNRGTTPVTRLDQRGLGPNPLLVWIYPLRSAGSRELNHSKSCMVR